MNTSLYASMAAVPMVDGPRRACVLTLVHSDLRCLPHDAVYRKAPHSDAPAPRDFFEHSIKRWGLGQGRSPASFQHIGRKVDVADVTGRDKAWVAALPEHIAGDETGANLEFQRQGRARSTFRGSNEELAGFVRRRNQYAVKVNGLSANSQRAVVVDEGVAADVRRTSLELSPKHGDQ